MPDSKQISLVRMQAGQSGKVVEIQGGYGMVNRLSALGIRPGKRITKVGSMLMRGPVTIQVDRAQVAVGFGMARRIIVEVG
jgi:ferrous iron transport protein A